VTRACAAVWLLVLGVVALGATVIGGSYVVFCLISNQPIDWSYACLAAEIGSVFGVIASILMIVVLRASTGEWPWKSPNTDKS